MDMLAVYSSKQLQDMLALINTIGESDNIKEFVESEIKKRMVLHNHYPKTCKYHPGQALKYISCQDYYECPVCHWAPEI